MSTNSNFSSDSKKIVQYHNDLIESVSARRNKADWVNKNPFYMLSSTEPIESIRSTVNETYINTPGKEMKPIGLIKVIWSNKEETDRTLCVIDDEVYKEMRNDGYYIEPYIPSKYDLPKENETRNLFIKLPLIPHINKLSLCQQHLNSRMNTLVLYGVWKKKDYSISYPDKSREHDMHGGKAFIVFYVSGNNKQEKMDILDRISLTRIFFSGTHWPGTSFKINCHWARKSKKRINMEDGHEHTTINFNKHDTIPIKKTTISVNTPIKQTLTDKDGFKIPKYHIKRANMSKDNAWSKPLKVGTKSSNIDNTSD